MKPLTPHWADQAAARVVAQNPTQEVYTVASGITPSGTVHIGNFREVITVDLVARALRSLGKKVRFIYSWDDFDTLRKVPKNLPQQDMLTENLRRPISRVPDPFGHDKSYAAHNEREFEEQIKHVGIAPEFLYQSERYGSALYAESIKHALENTDAIKTILNRYRSEPLAADWLPTAIYCSKCQRDQMDYERYPGGYDYSYKCTLCGNEETVDIRKTKDLKLNWRTDWPMRWAYEKVDFEPGGKDHSSDGGSFDTGKQIVKALWNREAPQYLQYDFVSIKGKAGKMSSSSGELITLGQALEVYEPQMVRWIFANQRPNTDFAISFDADVIKVYEEFDKTEIQALGPEPQNPGKWPVLRRAYELSCVGEVPQKAPYRAPFRELTGRLQIFDGDVERTWDRWYKTPERTEEDKAAFVSRASRAWNWVKDSAPDEFRYHINKAPVKVELTTLQTSAIQALLELLNHVDLEKIEAKDLNQRLFDDIIRKVEIDSKEFFLAVYQKVVNRDQGPRLPTFLKDLGAERIRLLLGDV